MRRNGRLFIILGVGLATLAVALAVMMFYGANQSKAVEKAPEPVKIVVAAQDVPPHTVLRDDMLTEQVVDKDLLKGGEAPSKSVVLGMAPKSGLVKGQRVMTSDLEVPGLTNDIDKGKRAVAVPLSQLNGMAGMVREGDYVDVIFSVKVNLLYVLPTRPLELDTSTAGDKTVNATLPASAPTDPAPYAYPGDPGSRFKMQNADGKGDPVAKVVIQDSKVLRVSSQPPANQQGQQGQQQAQQQSANNQQGQANAATPSDMIVLEMTDQQAEVMKFIQDNGGSFTFALRAKDDHEVANTAGITYDLLVTNFQLPAPKSVRLPGDKQP